MGGCYSNSVLVGGCIPSKVWEKGLNYRLPVPGKVE